MADEILGWQDDPGGPGSAVQPVRRPAPDLHQAPLAVSIAGEGSPPQLYEQGTVEFRYWVAADALQRGAGLWRALCPGLTWYRTVGEALDIRLDQGEDLNAYYDRRGLRFFHARVQGTTVFSGESPDVVSHEMGHAILDALRPQLFQAPYIEAGALHESFGDMAAILCALELEAVRVAVLEETGGHLQRSSRVSRIAEQLGWGIRVAAPDAVEPDCLRNAANSFFYQAPETLPPSAPSSNLSSAPHSFSRVFTAAFLRALAAMLAARPSQDEAALAEVARELGSILVDAVVASPVVPAYFSQVAAHMIEADLDRFSGRNGEALKCAFMRHGILSLESTNALHLAGHGAALSRQRAHVAGGDGDGEPWMVALPGQRFGLTEDLLVEAIAETKRFSVAGAAPDQGEVSAPAHDQAARSFVEDLFRSDSVDLSPVEGAARAAPTRPSKHSHQVRREEPGLMLRRCHFDCGPGVR